MGTVSVKLEDLVEGMIIAQDIFSGNVLLVTKGTKLNQAIIFRLKRDIYNHNNFTVLVYSDKAAEIRAEEPVFESKNLTFDEDVKERVLTSMDYIFNSEDIEEVAETAMSVSEMLVNEISNSSFSAVCLEELKMCDNYTFNHCIDVASMGLMVAKELKFSEAMLKEIGTAGILHDIGKQDVPSEILNKNGKLTNEEFDIMKKHPIFGYNRIKDTNLPMSVKLGVLQHHEKYCGGGYPLGIDGKNISLTARVLAVADVYAALVTKRSYKEAMKQSTCIETMYGMARQFDMDIFREFLKIVVAFPNDSIVDLSNGKRAKVVNQNMGYPLRPTIKFSDGRIANLSSDLNCADIIITG